MKKEDCDFSEFFSIRSGGKMKGYVCYNFRLFTNGILYRKPLFSFSISSFEKPSSYSQLVAIISRLIAVVVVKNWKIYNMSFSISSMQMKKRNLSLLKNRFSSSIHEFLCCVE